MIDPNPEKDIPPAKLYAELVTHRVEKQINGILNHKIQNIRNWGTLIVSLAAVGAGLLGYNKLDEWQSGTLKKVEIEAESQVESLVETAKSSFETDLKRKLTEAENSLNKTIDRTQKWSGDEIDRMQELGGELYQSLGRLREKVEIDAKAMGDQAADVTEALSQVTTSSRKVLDDIESETQRALKGSRATLSDINTQTLQSLESYQNQLEEIEQNSHKLEEAIAQSVQLHAELDLLKTSFSTARTDLAEQVLAVTKMNEESKTHLAELQPAIEDIRNLREFVREENSAVIFRQLQLDYSRIKSFEVRLNFVFLPEAAQQKISPLFGNMWLKRSGVEALQLHRDGDRNTSLAGADSYKILTYFQLFAPFEHDLMGRNIRELNGLDEVSLDFTIRADEVADVDALELEQFESQICSQLNSACDLFIGVEFDVVINGLPVFRKSIDKTEFLSEWSKLDTEDIDISNGLALELGWSVADLFKDAEGYYWNQLGREELFGGH